MKLKKNLKMSDKLLTNVKKPNTFYCSNCVYPSSFARVMSFDEKGICSGCETSKEKFKIEWKERKKQLIEILEENKKNKNSNDIYDCIIPVSGGKDSFFQAHTIKSLGYNALLVTYNGNNYSKTGLRNVQKMRESFGFDHIFFTPAVSTLKKLNRLGMLIMGDMDWHNHIGIATYPIKVAVEKNIPIMIWGEHGDTDLGGMYSMSDMNEFTLRERTEHVGRGYDWHHMIDLSVIHGEKLEKREMNGFIYPTNNEIDQVGIRGLYLGNYVYWEANDHLKLMIEEYGFELQEEGFERTYRKGSSLDNIYENGIHDYMKFIKFGYGRATDHGCKDIRAKKLTRNEAVSEINKRDHIKSKDLKIWLNYVGWTEEKFDEVADTFRDPRVWWIKNGEWWKNNLNGKPSSYGLVKLKKKYWTNYHIEY